MGNRFNTEYANLWKEVPLFLRFSLGRKRAREGQGRILIVNTCLVGEFAASMPAIRQFIITHPDATVDLMVTPPLRNLAEHIKGIGTVYTAASIYRRESTESGDVSFPEPYDGIIALRMSRDAREALEEASAEWVKTAAPHFIKFGVHLLASLGMRRVPKQWRTLNFEMLGLEPVELSCADILSYTDAERARIQHLEAFQSPGKVVIVHTGTKWRMKRWENARWAELLTMLNGLGNLRFVFVGAKEDVDDYTDIASRLSFSVDSLIGELNLTELTIALSEANYFIGIDSGPMNLAHLVDLPSVSLLGPGPHMYLPWSERDMYIDKTRGRGLYQMFFATEKSFMQQIEPNDVYDAFMRLYRTTT